MQALLCIKQVSGGVCQLICREERGQMDHVTLDAMVIMSQKFLRMLFAPNAYCFALVNITCSKSWGRRHLRNNFGTTHQQPADDNQSQ